MIPKIRRRKGNDGFTLIELTIVVLVILILLGLAVPRFSQITDSARQAECIANIRAIEMAVTQWEQKNRAAFPQGRISLAGLGGNGNASYDLRPYVDDIGTFDCPTANTAAGEYYYIIPGNDKTNKYANYFPGVNCYTYGRPPSLANTNPHTSYTQDPY